MQIFTCLKLSIIFSQGLTFHSFNITQSQSFSFLAFVLLACICFIASKIVLFSWINYFHTVLIMLINICLNWTLFLQSNSFNCLPRRSAFTLSCKNEWEWKRAHLWELEREIKKSIKTGLLYVTAYVTLSIDMHG